LGVTYLRILSAREAYFRVFNVSSYAVDDGEMHTIRAVLELPPRESLSNRVSFESL
jgi:hypothetical protein